ncbi:MAG: DNA modification methylase, partial [Chloroflexi bacterium]|nr:DNA modification methylase [Chloroflexota bacterium]
MRRSSSSTQLNLFSPESESTKKIGIIKPDTSTTFANNVSLPIHRWFRYSAGFSAAWVRELLDEQKTAGRTAVVDPFAGSGTVLLEAEMAGIASAGIEAHPFVVRVAQAKLHWRQNPPQFREFAFALLEQARTHPGDTSDYPSLITKCFPDHVLAQLDSLRRAWQAVNDNSALSSLTWLALVSILRECSPVGTAQWQYILPNKTKARVTDPYSAFSTKVSSMVEDMSYCQRHTHEGEAHL